MRYQGKLKKWDADRGYGFIEADDGGQDIFVHVSAFARDGTAPTEGERLSFEIEPDRDGKKKAVRVSRPGMQPALCTTPPRSARPANPASSGTGFGSKLILLLILASLGLYGYNHYTKRTAQMRAEQAELLLPEPPPAPANFRCDGRRYCTQMTSCQEAKYFLANCPGVKMDGNGDGLPCEMQWCK
jgi:cold shock CspA family protein